MKHLVRGNDVENGEFGDALGMIEGRPMPDAPSAIVSDHGKLVEAEMTHDFDLVQSHGAL